MGLNQTCNGPLSCKCEEDDDGCEVCCGLIWSIRQGSIYPSRNLSPDNLLGWWVFGPDGCCGWDERGPFPCQKSAETYEAITRAPWASIEEHVRLLGERAARGFLLKKYAGRFYQRERFERIEGEPAQAQNARNAARRWVLLA